MMEDPSQPLLKLSHAVTIYDGVRMMVEAWDSVPKSVVINGWGKVSICAPFQMKNLTDGLLAAGDARERAQRPIIGTLFE